jgi:UDPglucose 6-dehydrogenase
MKILIGYSGISHLSLNYASVSAEKGFNIICYDQDINLINSLKSEKIEIFEPGLQKLLSKNKKKIIFTNDINLLKKCNLVFVALDIKTDTKGKSIFNKLNKVIQLTTQNINKNCILIIQSQVPPGFISKIKWNKKKLYYQVETLIFGKAVKRALSPERIIIGKNNDSLNKYYKIYLKKFKCPKILMNYKSAELTKIFINIYLISQVTTTNVLSEYAENNGANWNDIKKAIMLDKRIGKNAYLSPGLGISGGNLERDLKTLSKLSNQRTEYKNLFNSFSKISKIRKDWVLLKLKKFRYLEKFKNIGILGLSYKEGTNSVKNSPSINLIKKIKKLNVSIIRTYDPKAKYENVKQMKNLKMVIKNSSILILMTPWKIFKSINFKDFKNVKIIIDPYNLMSKNQFTNKQTYISMGH